MIEIRVRSVERFVVTRFTRNPETGDAGSQVCGEFENAYQADDVAGALFQRAASEGKEVSVVYADGEQVDGDAVQDARLAALDSTVLIAELLRRKGVGKAPKTVSYGCPHYDTVLGIGDDHIATLTLSQDALERLQQMPGVTLTQAPSEDSGGDVERVEKF